MVEQAVVKRYVGALFNAALHAHVVPDVEADLRAISDVFGHSPRLMSLLSAPLLDLRRKKQILTNVFAGRVNDLTLRFIVLLLDKRREEVLPAAFEEFSRLHYVHRGIKPGHLFVAQPVSDREVDAIAAVLGRRFGGTVELDVEVQPELIGGARVILGDTVLDGSVRRRLRRLRDHLTSPARR